MDSLQDGRKKFSVYEYCHGSTVTFFSKGVIRDFGENKVIFVEGHQIVASVMPLQDSDELKKIGHLYA